MSIGDVLEDIMTPFCSSVLYWNQLPHETVTMALIKEHEAIVALESHLPAFQAIIQGGWDDLLELLDKSPKARPVFCPTTRANIVHDFQIAHASEYADRAQGVRIHDIQRLKVLVVETQRGFFAIRVKKFNEQLISANALTDQVRDFKGQRQLEGLPKTFNIELGYVLNKGGLAIAQICLVSPNGPSDNYWDNDLLVGGTDQHGKVLEMFEHVKPKEGADEDDSVAVVPKPDENVVPIKRDDHEKT